MFQAFPDTLINVELKAPTDDLISETNRLIKKYNRKKITIWGCRHKRFTDKLQEANSEVATFFSAERIMRTYLMYFLGLLPFMSISECSMQIPALTKEYEDSLLNSKFPDSL